MKATANTPAAHIDNLVEDFILKTEWRHNVIFTQREE